MVDHYSGALPPKGNWRHVCTASEHKPVFLINDEAVCPYCGQTKQRGIANSIYEAALLVFEQGQTWDSAADFLGMPPQALQQGVGELLQLSMSPMSFSGTLPFPASTSLDELQTTHQEFCLSRIKAMKESWFDVSAV